MKIKFNEKTKIIAIFGALFVVVLVLLLLIFNQGKKYYTVRFDLDGGTLVEGVVVQVVMQGQDAVPPAVQKDGFTLSSWSDSYQGVNNDRVIKAIWTRPTTSGINISDGTNYSTISGAYRYIQGDVFLPSYNGSRRILGIADNAFANCTGITSVSLPSEILSIGSRAFAGCTSLVEIQTPDTVVHLGTAAFSGCTSLEKVTLNEGIQTIGSYTFEECTSLTEVVIPQSVTRINAQSFVNCKSLESIVLPEGIEVIDSDAFTGCRNLVIKVPFEKNQAPEGWKKGWYGDAQVEWGYSAENEESAQ